MEARFQVVVGLSSYENYDVVEGRCQSRRSASTPEKLRSTSLYSHYRRRQIIRQALYTRLRQKEGCVFNLYVHMIPYSSVTSKQIYGI